MATIRRYGPSMVAPAVSPRPELGNGAAKTFEVFRQGFDAVNKFIEPAVIEVQTAKGEREALAELGPERPKGGLVGPRSGTGVVPGQAPSEDDQALAEHNGRSFEMRLPFTVRAQAFNATAERVITARTSTLLTELMSQAQAQATSMEDLNARMAKARDTVMGQIPTTLSGLRTSVQLSWETGIEQMRRQRIAAAAAGAAQQTKEARDEQITATEKETERLIATGASGGVVAAHLALATDELAQFGPREAFTIGGVEYAADPKRAGIMTPEAIADKMSGMQEKANSLIVEHDFLMTDAPGAYVQEFEAAVARGESPFSLGESLDMIRKMRAEAYTRESRREAAAQDALGLLDKAVDEGVASFMSLTEAGVPATMPQDQRDAMLTALAPYPERRREAVEQFAVMDAAAATAGMDGPALRAYIEETRARVRAAAEAGNIDSAGVAVINSLSDRLDGISDSITAEGIGLPAIESQAKRGRLVEDVDYDALREQAQGNPEVLSRIAETEAIHREAEAMMENGLSAAQREMLIERARAQKADMAGDAKGMGAEAVASMGVLDGLEKWSKSLTEMAEKDPTRFAATIGVQLAGFDGVETMAQAGQVVVSRVAALSARAKAEGVDNVVPLSDAEVETISETFQNSTRADQLGFIAEVSRLGEDQALAVYERIGAAEPTLFAAGTIYTGGNKEAAALILRGSVDTKLAGGTATDVSLAREAVMAPLLEADMIAPEGIRSIDTAALAYARGLAMSEGGREIKQDDIEQGYQIALGQQADGTGGLAQTKYGLTILPGGWTARRVNRAVGRIDDAQLTQIARGMVVDALGRPFSADALVDSIEELRPSPDDPSILVPLDADGGFFVTDNGGEQGILTFDLREFE